MDNENNIKIEKVNHSFRDYESMGEALLFEDIERLRFKLANICSFFLSTIFGWCLAMIIMNTLVVLSILILILCCDISLLSSSIITDIIIPDKLKEIYEKAYYIYGEISIGSSLIERIEVAFFKQEEADDFLASLMSGVVSEKRKCFKCQIEMNYGHFYISNISKIPILQLEKIWNSPHIQLFCCSCYKKKLRFKKWRKKTRTIY